MSILRKPLPFLLLLYVAASAYGQDSRHALTLGWEAYDHERYDAAYDHFQAAMQQAEPAVQLEALAGLIHAKISQPEQGDVDDLIRRGDALIPQSKEAESIGLYQVAKGEYLRSISEFRQALDLQKKAYQRCKNLEENSLAAAYALLYIAVNYEKMSQPDSSLRYAEASLRRFESQLDSTDVKYANIYNLVANSHYRMSRFETAERYYRQAKRIAEQSIGPFSDHLSACLGNLANIARIKQDYEQAIAFSEQALGIKKAKKDTAGMSSDYYSLGVFHYFNGDYGRARDYLAECIAIRESIYEPGHYRLSDPYEVMGIVHEQAGDYPQTLRYFLKARKIKIANFGATNIPVGYNSENIALLYQKLGAPDSALHYILEANRILTEQLPAGHYSLATHFYSLADIYMDNRQWEKARRALSRSNQTYRALGLSQSPEFTLNLSCEARLESKLLRWKQADELFASALQRIRSPEMPAPYRAEPASLTVLDQYLQYLYFKYRHTKDRKLLAAFSKTADDFLVTSSHFRKQFNDPYTRSLIAKSNAQIYRNIIGVFSQLYFSTANPDFLEQVYRFAESSRTSSLRDQLDGRIKRYTGIPDSLLEKERRLKEAISRLNIQQLEFPDSSALRSELLEREAQFDKYVATLTTSYPKYFELRYSSRILPLPAARQRLKGNQQIVQYIEDDTSYYALIISREESRLLPIGRRQTIDPLIDSYQTAIRSVDFAAFREVSRSLYDRLWALPAKHLTAEEVVIIPVNALFYLNLENLMNESGRYLIQDYALSYAFSVYDLFSNPAPAGPSPRRQLTIAPGFEDAMKEDYLSSLDTFAIPDQAYLRTVRQPWCLRLSRSLEEQFGFQSFTGTAASEPNIKAALGEGQILNFATHALASSLDPLRSKIFLAKDPSSPQEDGYLHTFEIYGLQLNAALTVLGACESGIGEIQDGEGMISLAYGIKYAGSPNTVMTLWKVDEKVNATLIENFFAQLSEGQPIRRALRRAKLDYLESAEVPFSHPFYWSGLIFNGAEGDLSLNIQRRTHWAWYLAGGTILIAGFLLWRRIFPS